MTATTRNVAVYVPGTGEILKTLGGPDSFIALNTPEGCAVIDAPIGTPEHLFRVDDTVEPPVIVPRPAFDFDLPGALAVGAIVNLPTPAGTALLVDGHRIGEGDAAGLEIEFASPGRYLVEVACWPFTPLLKRILVD